MRTITKKKNESMQRGQGLTALRIKKHKFYTQSQKWYAHVILKTCITSLTVRDLRSEYVFWASKKDSRGKRSLEKHASRTAEQPFKNVKQYQLIEQEYQDTSRDEDWEIQNPYPRTCMESKWNKWQSVMNWENRTLSQWRRNPSKEK